METISPTAETLDLPNPGTLSETNNGRDSFVPGFNLPAQPTVLSSQQSPKSVLVLTPDSNRYRLLTKSIKPLGLSAYQISGWKQLRMILHRRVGEHRLVIVDGYHINRTAQEMVYSLRAIDPNISILMLDMLTKANQRKLEKYGGILTARANPVRPTIKLAIGRLLAHHHALENLRNCRLNIDSFAA